MKAPERNNLTIMAVSMMILVGLEVVDLYVRFINWLTIQ